MGQNERKENVRFNLNVTVSAIPFVPKVSGLEQESFLPSLQASWMAVPSAGVLTHLQSLVGWVGSSADLAWALACLGVGQL